MTILTVEEQIQAMWKYYEDMNLQWEYTFDEYIAHLEYIKISENK